MNIVEVEGLSRNFGQLVAVDKVSFQVTEGEIFGFLGPNGAGKTTTINMLCTLLKPTRGKATVNGYDVVKQCNQVRRSIGLVFQEPTLDEYLTAEQNLPGEICPRTCWLSGRASAAATSPRSCAGHEIPPRRCGKSSRKFFNH